ncbi:hypothetical protein OK349_13445 [Sphingomonas sp. BT-65]|uniref:hypothetical protein n=1 Tax=Sphingomonas sp. BT-65 TaxID=2989821 RepID=UPI00223612CE|nr:hypothetical protein [Sphingomonas sp. BT-65]MCW4462715.1 hypothetical protein [Sphingomonas sp. BT-65]
MAFRTLATADKSAFDAVVDREAQVGLERSQRLLGANEGRVALNNCGSTATEDCTVTYAIAGVDYQLVRSAPNMRALLGGIVRYSDAMAELCEAEDLETVKSRSEGAAGAVKALAALIPGMPAITNAIIDAATFAGNERLRTKRRKALLQVALAAREPIAAASQVVAEQTAALKGSILAGGAENIAATQAVIVRGQAEERRLLNGRPLEQAVLTAAERGRVEALRAERRQALALLVEQSRQIGSARKLGAEWGKLNAAHEKLIAKLQNPDLSLEDALADINAVLALLDAIKGES